MRISDWSSDVCSSDLLEQMNKGAEFLRQITDFASFCKSHAGSGTTLCTLARAEWIETTDGLTFHISANRFLRNMVRAVVGTLLEVGRGKLSLADLKVIAGRGNRSDEIGRASCRERGGQYV